MVQKTVHLKAKTGSFPEAPGIYLMKDERGEVIYVGKAKNLRARVRSYFAQSADAWRLITRKIEEVADVDVVVAGSDKEALILESNFIKQFRPKYNVLFRDDKSFVSIKIALGEPWPRPIVTRKLDDEKALYFGPYASAKAARETMRVVQDVFPLRKCSIRECREAGRPCLYAEMGKCLAPCCADVTEQQYTRMVDQVTMFLRGKSEELLQQLELEMREASERLEFEKSARLRDRIQAIHTTLEKQQAASTGEAVDRDIFGLAHVDRNVWAAVLFVRDGKLQDAASYKFRASLDKPDAIFGAFLNQFYASNCFIPSEVLVPVETEDAAVLQDWLSEKKGRRVRVICPVRGDKKRLVELANRNAREAERVSTSEEQKREQEMESLKDILGLSRLPRNIECFDISTMLGREAVGSMVVFREGEPDKSSYRRYRIRWAEGQDDFAMMREVITRRCRHVVERSGDEFEKELPGLIVVDGGRPQLSAALEALSGLGLRPHNIAALAKERTVGGERVKHERVYLPGRAAPIELPEHSYGFRLITRIRDEAHRFAISYHRKVRAQEQMKSPLTDVPGVGPKLARRLMERFGGLDKVSAASIEELRAVKGISGRVARAIKEHSAKLTNRPPVSPA